MTHNGRDGETTMHNSRDGETTMHNCGSRETRKGRTAVRPYYLHTPKGC